MIISASLKAQVSTDTCNGHFQVVINTDSINRIPCKIMVIMNPATYADYYHSKKKLIELREEFPKYQGIIDSLMIVNEQQKVMTDSIYKLMNEKIELETKSKLEYKEKNIKLARRVEHLKIWAISGTGLSVILFILLL